MNLMEKIGGEEVKAGEESVEADKAFNSQIAKIKRVYHEMDNNSTDELVSKPATNGGSQSSEAYRKLAKVKDHQASKLSPILEKVCLVEDESSSFIQSYKASKEKMAALKIKLVSTKRASRKECAWLNALRDSSDKFFTIFKRSQAVDMYIADMVFMVISNIHFYYLSMGITLDFFVVFDPYPFLDFANIYPSRAIIDVCDEYLIDEPED
ncbi:hypothetical protein POTOM_005547 [Populus tomentosa]|uniref:Uncharacterized protein n=1 Tax=Populus tomentosa TaxID=118781 RepID=A0A8X8AJF8_POPTO|nr:hypothetical protein POTOM_005547 [Populus tomentosa]